MAYSECPFNNIGKEIKCRIKNELGKQKVCNYFACHQNFDKLAYLTAHLFIGDVAVKCDKGGNVSSDPTFIDRGSVAVAGKAC